MIDSSLHSILCKSGFDDKEAKVYLALLELGRATAGTISLRADVKRSITYHVLGRLMRRAYVSEATKGNIREFSCTDPAAIFQNLKSVVDDFRFLLPMFQFAKNKTQRKHVEYFEGRDAVEQVYRGFQRSKEERYLTSISQLKKIIPKELDIWINRYTKQKRHIPIKIITSNTVEDKAWASSTQSASIIIRVSSDICVRLGMQD